MSSDLSRWVTIVEVVANVVLAVGGVSGGVWALMQWREERKLRYANFLNDLLGRFETANVNGVFYLIDDARFGMRSQWQSWYKDVFADRNKESALDSLLLFLSNVCYLQQQNLVDASVSNFFAYHLESVLFCSEIQDYLRKGLVACKGRANPFAHLIAMAKSKGIEL